MAVLREFSPSRIAEQKRHRCSSRPSLFWIDIELCLALCNEAEEFHHLCDYVPLRRVSADRKSLRRVKLAFWRGSTTQGTPADEPLARHQSQSWADPKRSTTSFYALTTPNQRIVGPHFGTLFGTLFGCAQLVPSPGVRFEVLHGAQGALREFHSFLLAWSKTTGLPFKRLDDRQLFGSRWRNVLGITRSA